MKKSYIFTISKYYNEDEIEKVAPIIENYVGIFADENGVATLKLKDDVSVVIKRDEGLVLHMVLDNADHFTALPKTLTKAKDFLNKFITAMAEAVDAYSQKVGIAKAKAKVEADAEDNLLDYISGGEPKATGCDCDGKCACGGPKVTVKVNGEEITDPKEKERVKEDIDAKVKEICDRAGAIFVDTFADILKSFTSDEDKAAQGDWLRNYVNR